MILDHPLTASLLFIFVYAQVQGILRKSISANQVHHHPQINSNSVINKVILTQRGYIQFLKYYIEVEPLTEYTFCIWVNSNNLTFSHPLLSYSKHEEERLIRVWISPHGHSINAEISNVRLFSLVVHLKENQWYHICQSWSSHSSEWNVFLDGHLLSKGVTPELRDHIIEGGGDIVVGQEYTDFDKGLEDGIEGAIYGFNFVLSSTSHSADFENAYSNDESNIKLTFGRKKREAVINWVPPATRYGVPVGEIKKIPSNDLIQRIEVFKPQEQENAPKQFPLRYGDKMKKVVPIGFDAETNKFPKNQSNIPSEEQEYSRRIFFKDSKSTVKSDVEKQIVFNGPLVNSLVNFGDIIFPKGQTKKSLGLLLVELSYDCSFKKGAPLDGPKVLVNWAKTTVRVFGGAILKSIPPFCK